MIEAALAAGAPIESPVAVVVAHPDDETLGVGARLAKLRDFKLIHLTDGAPRDLRDAQREGFSDRDGYAAARARELERALHALGAHPRECIGYDCVDQETAGQLIAVVQRLCDDLADTQIVITHAYEHGHPDHDTCAFAVHAACALLRRMRGGAPAIVEFPSYHLRNGEWIAGEFWADAGRPERTALLDARERRNKARAIACFRTQRQMLSAFPLDRECYRAAPAYDFRRPAPPRQAFYDALGWNINAARWRRYAAEALRAFDLTEEP
jgi:LmbE family N-acetylglucosaminyl deacetylase